MPVESPTARARTANDAAAPKAEHAPRFAKCDEAWLRMPLGGRELRVLLALSLYADWKPNGNGRCYPKRDTLALATGLQVSHVSESIRKLAELGLITVVRLGRKNLYYVRPIGSTALMPPSDPEPFFRYIAALGIRIEMTSDLKLRYAPGSVHFDEFHPLYQAIFSDYANGLMTSRFTALLPILSSEETTTVA